MAKYFLVENRQQIHLGPVEWSHYRMFQSELDDLGINYTISPSAESYVNIDGKYEIIPLGTTIVPEHDSVYEELVGPSITFDNNQAHQTYTKRNRNIESVKSSLYSIIATERYEYEIKGIEYTLGGVSVTLPTDREGKKQFTDILATIGDSSISYKFNGNFYTLSKSDVEAIISAINTYVQSQYDWEHSVHTQIQNATTLDELKAINIKK